MKRRIFLILCLGLAFLLPRPAFPGYGRALAPRVTKNEIPSVPNTAESLRLDGVPNEPFWDHALVLKLPYEIDPGENIPAKVKTECLIITGPKSLYIAFHAHDPDRSTIRARYMDRDMAWDENGVFVTLDPFFDQRRGFQFLANAFGVQMDSLLNEVANSKEQVDMTWDAIWDASGRIYHGNGDAPMRPSPRDLSYYFRATPWKRNRS
jgi:hypothetical protein